MFSDPSTWFTMILPQLTLLLLMIALIAVGALAYTFQRRDRDSDKQLAITKLDFIHLCGERKGVGQACEKCLWNLYKVGVGG